MTEKYLLVESMNKEFPYSVKIAHDVIINLRNEYQETRYFEVGGILFGKINEQNNIVSIEKLSLIKSRVKFKFQYTRNYKKAQKKTNKVWKETKGLLNYIGEWHTHPGISPLPSFTDRQSIINQTKEKKSDYFPFTILVVIGNEERISLTISNEREIIQCIHIQ